MSTTPLRTCVQKTLTLSCTVTAKMLLRPGDWPQIRKRWTVRQNRAHSRRLPTSNGQHAIQCITGEIFEWSDGKSSREKCWLRSRSRLLIDFGPLLRACVLVDIPLHHRIILYASLHKEYITGILQKFIGVDFDFKLQSLYPDWRETSTNLIYKSTSNC